jgi:hypothetical protein
MDFNSQTGINRQMKVKYDAVNQTFMVARFAPDPAIVPPPHLVNDGKSNMRSDSPANIDERRVEKLASLRPKWK